MEENNGESLENFSWFISQKFEINESDLISCLHNDKKNYWNTLFNLINDKRKLMNGTEEITEDNKNKENGIENKDDIIKEIDNYFKENPEEVEPTWNKYKKEVLKIDVKNPNPPKEKPIAPKIIDKKSSIRNKMSNSLKVKVQPSQKRKQSFAIQNNNIQKFNFSIGFPGAGPQESDNIKRITTMNFSNNHNSLLNRPKNKKNKFANFRLNKNINDNKLRNSMYLNIKKNPNFEFAPKKFLNSKNLRKSTNQKHNLSASFKYSFNNSTDNNQTDSSIIKISKKKFNELIHKNPIEENENEFGDNLYEEIEEKDEEKSPGKKEENSDNKSENKVGNGNENEDKILSFEESDLESKVNLDDMNNHNGPNTSEKNKELTNKGTDYNIEHKPDYSKDYELSKEITNQKIKINNENEKNKDKEEANIPLYKTKNNIFTLKKPRTKPNIKNSSDSKPKPKVYLNLSLCRQVNFSLYIKKKSQNLTNSVPNLRKEKKDETNKSLELLAKKDSIKKDNNTIIATRSDQKLARKNIEIKDPYIVNNRNRMMNNNNKKNLSYSKSKNMNTNMRNKNYFPIVKINNNSLYKMKMNNTFYKYQKNNNHRSEYLKTNKSKDYKKRRIHNSQQNLNSKHYKINKYNNNNYNKYIKINNVSGLNKLKKDINKKNRSNTRERESSKKRKKNRVLNESLNSKLKLNGKEDGLDRIKNNYLKKYQETIENIMKNDDVIFNENSRFITYTDRENRGDRSDSKRKNDSSLSYHRTKIKIKKVNNSKSKISPYKSKNNKVASRNAIKRYIHSSMDNIY